MTDSTTTNKSNRVPHNASILPAIKNEILALADDERRTASSMTEILLQEALMHREQLSKKAS